MFTLFNRLWLPLFDTNEGGSGGSGGEGGEGGQEQGSERAASQTDPPWKSEEFDSERAWKKIRAQEADKKKQKDRIDALEKEKKEREDAEKTDGQRLEERATTAEAGEKSAKADAARLRVALKKGLTESQARRLVGQTEEELEQDADELLKSFGNGDGGEGQESRGRPKENLRPGAAPSSSEDDEPSDPAELAKRVPRRSW